MLESELPEIPGTAFRARIRRAWGYLDRLWHLLGELPRQGPGSATPVCSREQLVEIEHWLAEAWKHCGPARKAAPARRRIPRTAPSANSRSNDFADLDVDLSRLQAGQGLLDIRIGSIPADNLDRLRDVLACPNHLILDVSGRRRDPAYRDRRQPRETPA